MANQRLVNGLVFVCESSLDTNPDVGNAAAGFALKTRVHINIGTHKMLLY